jgi:putative transcriptional regulator
MNNWEQGRRKPDPAARVLLQVIEKNPDAVRQALAPEA